MQTSTVSLILVGGTLAAIIAVQFALLNSIRKELLAWTETAEAQSALRWKVIENVMQQVARAAGVDGQIIWPVYFDESAPTPGKAGEASGHTGTERVV